MPSRDHSDTPRAMNLGLRYPKKPHHDCDLWTDELRSGYLVSYAIDPTERGIERAECKAKLCAGLLANVISKEITDDDEVDVLRRTLEKELIKSVSALATSQSPSFYNNSIRVEDGHRFHPNLRRLLTAGRMVEIAVNLAAANPGRSISVKTLYETLLMELVSHGAKKGGASQLPYYNDADSIRDAWNDTRSALHIAGSFHTLYGPDTKPLLHDERPFKLLRDRCSDFFDYAEAYQEFLSGREVWTADGVKLHHSKPLNKGVYWEIPRRKKKGSLRLSALRAAGAELPGSFSTKRKPIAENSP
jgi:hypothetical protein